MTAKEKKSEQARAYREANRDKVLAGKKAWYEKNKERILAEQAAYYAAHREERRVVVRARYLANKARLNEQQRQKYAVDPKRRLVNNRKYRAARLDEFRARDKHYAKAYQERHPDRFVEIHRRATLTRRALVVGAFVESVDALTVFRRDNGVCGICHHKVDPKSKWHVDHVIPLSKGGVHSYDNVQLTHARCNLSKQGRLPKGQLGLFQKQMLVLGGAK